MRNDVSDPLFSKLKDMEMENLIQKEANSEKFLSLLLGIVKQFYLKFKLQKTCDEEVDQFLEKIYGMLDCSRIEWADLKNTKDSFGEKIASDYVTLVPILDERKLTEFHVPHTVHFSPITYDVSKIYKSNILKPVPNHEPILNHHLSVLNETCNVETPVSSKKFSSLKGTPPSRKESLDKETVLCDSILGNDIPESPNATFSEESQTAYSESEAVTSRPLSPVLSFANTTITITKDSPISDKETCIKKDDDTVFCSDYDPLQASINLDVPSPASVNSGDSSQSLVNSTFSVLNPENITGTHSPNITGTHSPKITGTYSPKIMSTHSPREKVTTLQPIQNVKNVMKKSTSFVQKNGSNSALKNKENKGAKTVAFGSSYSGTPKRKLSSKRSITFSQLPNVTTEQSKKRASSIDLFRGGEQFTNGSESKRVDSTVNEFPGVKSEFGKCLTPSCSQCWNEKIQPWNPVENPFKKHQSYWSEALVSSFKR
ncbi:hypothetical protein Anas_10047 [Armadillidium nasatum]|uniref:Uncharacterized protein n=1 Tax=Armadillidium nasatum TaxID=96803 RepID=A0A5N5SQW3_9CRUS|nr:hypothetical protein Anas_10047 [Armadillidium nasatum]